MGLQRALFLCPLLLRFFSVGAGSQELEALQASIAAQKVCAPRFPPSYSSPHTAEKSSWRNRSCCVARGTSTQTRKGTGSPRPRRPPASTRCATPDASSLATHLLVLA